MTRRSDARFRFTLVVACLFGFARRAHAEPSVAVVDTRGFGVYEASTAAVTRQLYATVARLGYRVAPETTTARLSAGFGPAPPSPAALLALATAAHVDHALAATLTTENGQYAVVLSLANADRTGPFFANRFATPQTLEATVAGMTRTLLPPAPADDSDANGARERPSGFRFALQTEGAFGIADHFFYNHMFGARLDYGFTEDIALGAYLGYVNLKGKDGRTSNVLPYLQLEYRIHPSKTAAWRIPIRFGPGYLPKNGPFLRLSAGPNFPIGKTAHLGFDLVAPTLWVVQNSIVASMDVAAEIAFDW